MNTDRLPKYYYFKSNMNHPQRELVRNRFNSKYKQDWTLGSNYYGYDGSKVHNGANCFLSPKWFINNPVEITMDQFLEMTEPIKTWTVEEFRKGEVVIKFENGNDTELLRKITGDYELRGSCLYYWCEPGKSYVCNNNQSPDSKLPVCSINDIIFPDEKIKVITKKLLGYKPKPTVKFEWYNSIMSDLGNNYDEKELKQQIINDGYWFIDGTVVSSKFEEAGVLDIWFDKVYEEDKKVFVISCTEGTFKLEVSKDGIYYRPDNVYLDISMLDDCTSNRNMGELASYTIRGKVEGHYAVSYSHINLGCKKAIPIKELKKVVEYCKTLQY